MKSRFEWPTYLLIAMTYGIFVLGALSASWSQILAIILLTIAGVLHSSLSHEVLHGHPTRYDWLNAVFVMPALTLFVPYFRFRDTHIAHHRDENLTDPYDDPETNFLDPVQWQKLSAWRQRVYLWNNTLLGRMVIGPIIGQLVFMRSDIHAIADGSGRIPLSWVVHIASVAVILWGLLTLTDVSLTTYVMASYFALSILKIRTFLEHRAHEDAPSRTVIIEDRGLFALFFLNNNFHSVHHTYPKVPWYELPELYERTKSEVIARNGGYVYRSYKEILAKYFVRTKDPVPHPLMTHPTSDT